MEQQPNDRANCPGTAGLSPNKSPLCHGCFGFRMSIIVWVLMAIFAYPLSWHPWVMPTLCSIVWDLGVSIVPIMNMLLESTRFICMNWILIHRELSFQAQSVRSRLEIWSVLTGNFSRWRQKVWFWWPSKSNPFAHGLARIAAGSSGSGYMKSVWYADMHIVSTKLRHSKVIVWVAILS